MCYQSRLFSLKSKCWSSTGVFLGFRNMFSGVFCAQIENLEHCEKIANKGRCVLMVSVVPHDEMISIRAHSIRMGFQCNLHTTKGPRPAKRNILLVCSYCLRGGVGGVHASSRIARQVFHRLNSNCSVALMADSTSPLSYFSWQEMFPFADLKGLHMASQALHLSWVFFGFA